MNTTNTPVELFLFLLVRDHLPIGTINQILLDVEKALNNGPVDYIGDAELISKWTEIKTKHLLGT